MKTAPFLAIALVATSGAVARPAVMPRAHPAVVRIVVPEPGGATLGSGALVAVNETRGLVVTNWHVVRDSRGRVDVLFPDGFRSTATVLAVDQPWDLAALVIWRPPVPPIPLASSVPRLGEPLAIAGYGRGSYRLASGRCTNYVSPGGNLPAEMIELSAGARQGDSGGPILNQRGELAGVLFGAAWGTTTGSHCGRVRQFLIPITGDIYGARVEEISRIAQRPPRDPPAAVPRADPTVPAAVPAAPAATHSAPRPATSAPATDPAGAGWVASARPAAQGERLQRDDVGVSIVSGWNTGQTPPPADLAAPSSPPAPPEPGPGPLEQTKTFLAAVGLLALLFHTLRLLAR